MSQPNSPSVALFPFLAVLVCAMGALILLLLVTTQKIRKVAVDRAIAKEVAAEESKKQADQEKSASQPRAPARLEPETVPEQPEIPDSKGPQLAPVSPTPEELAAKAAEKRALKVAREARQRANLEAKGRQLQREQEWQRLLAELEDKREQTREQMKEARAFVADLKSRLQRTEINLQKLQDRKAELASKQEQDAELRAKIEKQHQDLAKAISTAQKEFSELRRVHAEASSKFAFIPYDGVSGTTRRPIYLECTAAGIRFQPDGILLNEDDLKGFTESQNPLLAATLAIADYWQATPQPDEDPRRPRRPYVLLLVRPGGTVAYYVARKMLSQIGDDFGYELIEDDFPLQIPPSDGKTKPIIEQAVAETLRKRGEAVAEGGRIGAPRLGQVMMGGSEDAIDFGSLDAQKTAAMAQKESPFSRNSTRNGKNFSITRSPVRSEELLPESFRSEIERHADEVQRQSTAAAGSGNAPSGRSGERLGRSPLTTNGIPPTRSSGASGPAGSPGAPGSAGSAGSPGSLGADGAQGLARTDSHPGSGTGTGSGPGFAAGSGSGSSALGQATGSATGRSTGALAGPGDPQGPEIIRNNSAAVEIQRGRGRRNQVTNSSVSGQNGVSDTGRSTGGQMGSGQVGTGQTAGPLGKISPLPTLTDPFARQQMVAADATRPTGLDPDAGLGFSGGAEPGTAGGTASGPRTGVGNRGGSGMTGPRGSSANGLASGANPDGPASLNGTISAEGELLQNGLADTAGTPISDGTSPARGSSGMTDFGPGGPQISGEQIGAPQIGSPGAASLGTVSDGAPSGTVTSTRARTAQRTTGLAPNQVLENPYVSDPATGGSPDNSAAGEAVQSGPANPSNGSIPGTRSANMVQVRPGTSAKSSQFQGTDVNSGPHDPDFDPRQSRPSKVVGVRTADGTRSVNSSGSSAGSSPNPFDRTSGAVVADQFAAAAERQMYSGKPARKSRGDVPQEEGKRPVRTLTPIQKQDLGRQRWGGSNIAQIGFERKVRVQVLADRIIIGKNEVEIPVETGTTREELVELVLDGLDENSHTWEKPPKKFYWIPYLQFEVYKGGVVQYEQLHGPLKEWGLSSDVKFKDGQPSQPGLIRPASKKL